MQRVKVCMWACKVSAIWLLLANCYAYESLSTKRTLSKSTAGTVFLVRQSGGVYGEPGYHCRLELRKQVERIPGAEAVLYSTSIPNELATIEEPVVSTIKALGQKVLLVTVRIALDGADPDKLDLVVIQGESVAVVSGSLFKPDGDGAWTVSSRENLKVKRSPALTNLEGERRLCELWLRAANETLSILNRK